MALNLSDGWNDTLNFKHSSESGIGLRHDITTRERKHWDILVAQDGSGDCTTIEDAIKLLTTAGGIIYISEGTYSIKTPIVIPYDGITIRGSGGGTIITQGTGWTGNKLIDVNLKKKFVIENLKLLRTSGTNYGIYLTNTSRCTADKIIFEDFVDYCVWIDGGGTANVINCQNEYNVLTEGFVMLSGTSKCQVINNAGITTKTGQIYLEGDSNNNIITGNISHWITIQNATCDNNIITGNQTDVTITDVGTGTVLANNSTF